MTTRNKISEQAERLYMRKFDREDLKPRIDRREVALLVDQVANEFLALEVRQGAKVGIVDIPSCMIANYTGTPAAISGVFSVALPAIPIPLPMDMGVWSVAPSPTGSAYIPIKTEFWDLLGSQDEGLLEGTVGFYVEGKTIYFTTEPAATVKIKLLIVDPALLNPFDAYPVPADMEIKIIEKVVLLLDSRGLAPEKMKG